MKHYLCAIALLTGAAAAAQTKASWGDEFKMTHRTDGLTIVAVDPTGEYIEEDRDAGRTSTDRGNPELVKLNPGLNEIYRNDFEKELHGKIFEGFLYLHERLYMFAHENEKKDGRKVNLFVAEVDKGAGKLKGDWKLIHTWQWPEKKETLRRRIVPNGDSSRVILVATYTGRVNNRYELQTLDANTMEPQGETMVITNEFDPKTFQIEDFVYMPGGNAVVVGRLYEYEEGKKKKDKNLQFKSYNVRIYSGDGKLVKDIGTDTEDKFLVTSRVMYLKNNLVMAAFYSNTRKRKEVNGMIVERINPATGEVINAVNKELNASSITEIDDDPADKKALRKSGDDEEGLTANLRFNKFYITPDDGILVLAEGFHQYETANTTQTANTYSTTWYMNYDCRDIYMAKVSAAGTIEWVHVLPKAQFESIVEGTSLATGAYYTGDYFDDDASRPFFAGFGSVEAGGKVHIFFNDYTDNGDILEPGKHVHRVYFYGHTSCYEVVLDMITGKYTRKELFSNRDIPNAMPRLGVAMGNTLYLTGEDAHFLGRTRMAVGRLTVD